MKRLHVLGSVTFIVLSVQRQRVRRETPGSSPRRCPLRARCWLSVAVSWRSFQGLPGNSVIPLLPTFEPMGAGTEW